jgi:hypothetical protein
MAVEKGIVSGYDDGLFKPENPITYDEAALIILRSLGYTEQILEIYDVSSVRSKILKSVPVNNITWSGAFQIAENLFNVNPLVIVSILSADVNSSLKESENNVWELCQDIYKVSGILELSGNLSTFYSSWADGEQLQISGEVFDKSSKDYSEYFGMYVNAYYYDDIYNDERTVLYMEPKGRQSKERIIAQKIISADKKAIKYELTDDSKTRKVEIAKGAAVIYNFNFLGDIETEYVQLDMLKPDNGCVSFIDNNNDGRAEVVIIEEYEVYKVERAGEEKIWVEGSDTVNTIDIDDETVIYKDDEVVSIGAVEADNVLQVYKSVAIPGISDEKIYLRVSDAKVSGKLQETDIDYVVINDTTYRIKDATVLENIVIDSSEVNLYLDSQGIVVFIEKQGNTSIQYGVPIVCKWDKIGDKFLIRMITDKNGVQTYEAADKITCINSFGNSERIEQEGYEAYFGSGESTVHNLIAFKLNKDSQISQIIEASDATNKDWGDYDKFSLDAIVQEGVNGVSSISYEANKINAKYYITGNSKAFVIPENNSTKSDDYTVLPAGEAISLSRPKAIEIYDLDENMQVAFVVIRSSADVSKSIPFSSSVGVVQSVNTAINENNDICYRLKIAINGEIKEYYTENQQTHHVESVYTNNTYWNNPGMTVGDLEYGDAIQISTNEEGYITAFRMMLDRSKSSESSFAVSSGDWTLGDYIIPGSDLGIYYGPVIKIPTQSNFVIRAAGEKLIVPGASPRSIKVYLCDSDKKEIEICEWSAVQSGDYVLVVLDWRYEREIVIYR